MIKKTLITAICLFAFLHGKVFASESDGAGVVYINSNKNLGIGIKTPLAKVHVNGSILIQDGTQSNGYLLTSDNNGLASWQSLGASSEWTDTGTLLHPSDLSGAETVVIGGVNSGAADIIFNPDGSAVFNEQANSVNFRIEGDTDTNLLTVNGTANQVGIGTINTKEILTVEGAIAFDEISAPGVDSGYGKVYVKSSDSLIYYKNSSGTEFSLTDNGSATPAGSDGYVQFNESNTLAANGNLYWQNIPSLYGLSVGHSESPNSILDIKGAFTYRTLDGAMPPSPANNASVLWMSDGTGNGDPGDTMIAATVNGETKVFTLIDFDNYNDPTYNGLTLNGLTASRLVRTDSNKKLTSETNIIIDGSGNIGIGLSTGNEKLTVDGVISLDQLSSAPNASAGYGKIYVNGSALYFKDGSGTEFNLTEDISPAGSNTEIQFNNSGTFGASSSLTWDGTSLLATNLKAGSGSASLPSYSFIVDTDTGIYSPAADEIALSTAGTQRLIIGESGNVGINKSSPEATLEVNGTVAYSPSDVTNITAGSGITATKTVMKVQGSAGAVDITANPQIAAGTDGQFLIIKGSSDSNTVLLEDGTGVSLDGGTSITLGDKDILVLIYDSNSSLWIETNRSNKI